MDSNNHSDIAIGANDECACVLVLHVTVAQIAHAIDVAHEVTSPHIRYVPDGSNLTHMSSVVRQQHMLPAQLMRIPGT